MNMTFLRHLKLEIASAIPVSNDEKKNSVPQGLGAAAGYIAVLKGSSF